MLDPIRDTDSTTIRWPLCAESCGPQVQAVDTSSLHSIPGPPALTHNQLFLLCLTGDMVVEYVGHLVRPRVADILEARTYNQLVGAGGLVGPTLPFQKTRIGAPEALELSW